MGGIEMYFVDREKLEEKLDFIKKQASLIQSQTSWETPIEKAALERLIHTIIEAITDTGTMMIDGFIMRDPGSYEDIIDILTDERVIPETLTPKLKNIISYRKSLVQHYEEVDHDKLLEGIHPYVEDLFTYCDCVRTYLTNELGPVTAFRN